MVKLKPAMFFFLALTASTVSAQDKCEIYADTVAVNMGDQYHMFFKAYSNKVKTYLENNARIAVDFETENPDVVTVGGAWFRAEKAGQAKMKAVIYQESPRLKDYPDWSNKLDSVSFVVKAPVEKFLAPLPEVPMTWGAAKDVVMSDVLQKYQAFSDTYYAMHPTITTEERALFDWFATNDYEYPLVALGWNNDGQLFSSNIIVNDAGRLGYKAESEITGYLTNQGFELLGWDEQGLLVMYRESDKTQASAMVLTMQGQYFRDLNFQYTPDKPTTGISSVALSMPKSGLNRNGNQLTVDVKDEKGEPIVVYSLSGQKLLQAVLKDGNNTFELTTAKPVIVRIGKSRGVKVM